MSDLDNEQENQFFISKNEINRREFFKKAGVVAGGSLLPVVLGGHLYSKSRKAVEKHSIIVPNMEETSYWETLMFSCLQGLLNRKTPTVFLFYPDKRKESWDSKYPVKDERIFYNWYQQYDFLEFTELDNPYAIFHQIDEDILSTINGYVIVDKEVPYTANIAATYAGIENLLPITETILERNQDILPNFKNERDLRGRFQGMSKLEVYKWAYDNQWPHTNHTRVANLGVPKNKDEVWTNSFFRSNRARDYTIAEKGFFFELKSDGEEYKLKDKILSEMEPRGYVFGWHQGAGEAAHIQHLSKNGQLALGASTMAANFSFHSRVEVPGAIDRFRQKIITGRKKFEKVEDKIYLTFVLSDGNSLNCITRMGFMGQWQLSERGEIPYGWEVLPLLVDVGPGILDYFQATATANDHFVLSASGMANFYPRATPINKLQGILQETDRYLEKTGQSSGVVMGPHGQTNEERTQMYHEILGDKINGIMEGYWRRSAQIARLYREEGNPKNATVWLPTSNPQGKRELSHWVKELKKLSNYRKQRPLFVPLHIPGHDLTITDMAKLVDELGDDFKAVSPDKFYKLFSQSRSDSVIVNPPESFPPETLKLPSGLTNTIKPKLQNFSTKSKEIELRIRITSPQLDIEMSDEKQLYLKKDTTEQFSFDVEIPQALKGSDGKLEYFLDSALVLVVPIKFV
jgi:hypothetical protein